MDEEAAQRSSKRTECPGSRPIPGPSERRDAVARSGERNCSVARTLDIVSDAWAFLIIREAFFGTQHIRGISCSARHSARDADRSAEEDSRGRASSARSRPGASRRKEYRLTKMGFDLYPSFIALMQFGDRWLAGETSRSLTLVHAACGCESHPLVACSECLEKARAREVTYRDGPGAGQTRARRPGRNAAALIRRSKFLLGRPSSVSRALQIIGDKWSFMVVREAFFGVRRYDQIQTNLSIAPNILTDRLSRLVAKACSARVSIRGRRRATNISSPTWDATSTVPSSRCWRGATAGYPEASPL